MPFDKTPAICTSCLTPLPEDLPEELCPNCLLSADTIATTVHTAGQTSYSAQFPPHATMRTENDPESIGVYKIMARLGEGGFGIVYHGEQQLPIRREVALKIIKPGMDSRQIIRRFEAERQTLALMEHPNIAAVLDAGATENDRPYFVMELVRGEPITAYCDSRKLTIRERLTLFIPVCSAVHHAHQKGVLHRDLKPSNILVTEVDGKAVPKVIDFGISKALTPATQTELQVSLLHSSEGMIIGTPQYMSPEQAGAAQDLDTRSDIYTLGVILYELLTGQTPLSLASVKQATFHEILRIVREVDPQRPSSRVIPVSELTKLNSTARKSEPGKLNRTLRGDLDWITLRALEKERERRYDSAAGLASDLERYLAGEPVAAGPPNAVYKFRKLVLRNRLAFGAAAAILLLLVMGIGVSTWQWSEAVKERKFKEVEFERAEKEKRAAQQLLVSAAWSSFHQAQRLFREADDDAKTDSTGMKSFGKSREGLLHLSNAIQFDPGNPLLRERFGWEIISRLESLRAVPQLNISSKTPPGDVHFSSDGKRLIPRSGGINATAWDAHSGKEIPFPAGSSRLLSVTEHKLLCADAVNLVRLLDSATGKALATLEAAGNVVLATFSPNEKWIATVNDDSQAAVWDAGSGKSLFSFSLDHTLVSSLGSRALTFNQDETKLIAIVEAKLAKLIDAMTGNFLATYQHAEPITSAVFSPSAPQILTTSKDHAAKLWSVADGTVIKSFAHESGINFAAFSPDGSMITTACDDFSARLWNLATGKELTVFAHDAMVDQVEFSPDGTFLLTAGGSNAAVVWDVATNSNLATLEHESKVKSARFSPDGSSIATTCEGLVIRTWDVTTNLRKANIGRIKCSPSVKPVMTRDSSTVVSQTTDCVQLWRANSGAPIADLRATAAFALSVDGKVLATCGTDHSVSLWSPLTGELIEKLPTEIAATKLTLNSDGSLLLLSNDAPVCQLWNTKHHRLLLSLPLEGQVGLMQFSPDQQAILTSQDKSVKVWSLAGKELFTLPHAGEVTLAEFSPNGKHIATISTADPARVWEVATGKAIMDLAQDGSSTLVRFSPDSRLVIAGSKNGDVGIWSLPEGKPLLSQQLKDEVTDVGFNAEGTRFVVASLNSFFVWIFDTRTGKQLAELPHNTSVFSAEFSPDGKNIVSADLDGTHQLWDGRTSRILAGAGDERSLGQFQLIAQALSGREISADGQIRELSESDMVRIQENLKSLGTVHFPSELNELAQWLCIATPTSPLTPYSETSRQSIFDALIQQGSEDDVRIAHALLPTRPEPLNKLAENWMKNDLDTMTEEERTLALPAEQARAAWLRKYAESINSKATHH